MGNSQSGKDTTKKTERKTSFMKEKEEIYSNLKSHSMYELDQNENKNLVKIFNFFKFNLENLSKKFNWR